MQQVVAQHGFTLSLPADYHAATALAYHGRDPAGPAERCSMDNIFSKGTSTLAMNTTSASGQEPPCHRYTTPLMMVSRWVPDSISVSMMGSRLAGI